MTKEKKMTSIFKTIFFIIILLALTGCSRSTPTELGTIEEKEWKYNEAYYLRTEYEDEIFEAFSDFEWNDDSRYVMYTITPREGDVLGAGSMYSKDFKPHSVIQEIMPKDLYDKIIQRKPIFVDSFTVTSVIVPIEAEANEELEVVGPIAYTYTYIERGAVTDIDTLVIKSLYIANSEDESPEYPYRDKKMLEEYLKNYTKWTN